MKSDWSKADPGPTPEQIAAYIDGELTGTEQARVATWLANHPASAATADSWRKLDDLCRDSAAPLPTPETWDAVLGRIATAKAKPEQPPRRWRVLLVGLATLAVLVSAWLLWPRGGSANPDRLEPFPVVAPGEVTILRFGIAELKMVPGISPLDPASPGSGITRSVSVSVVTIIASETDDKIDERLTGLADELKKNNPKLTGFRLSAISTKSIPVGSRERFHFMDDQIADIVVARRLAKDNRVELRVTTPPEVGQLSYEVVGGKFLPMITPYRTEKGETVLIAVRAQFGAEK